MWIVGRCIVYNGIRLQLLFVHLFLCFFSIQFSNITIFRHTFLRNCEALKVATLYTRGQWTDSLCIPESGYCCLFVPLFLQFSFSQFFVTLFSGTVRLRRLKLVHTWTVGRCIMYTGIRLLLLIRPFISSFFFLSIFFFPVSPIFSSYVFSSDSATAGL